MAGFNLKFNPEKECKKEIGETLKKIRDAEKKWRDKIKIETETGFYFQIVFKSEEEKNIWLKKHNINLNSNDFVFIEDFEKNYKRGNK